MTNLVAIIMKQVQLQELVACARHVDARQIRLHVMDRRVDVRDAASALAEHCPEAQLRMLRTSRDDDAALAALFTAPADVFALPIYHASAFYRRIPALRRQATVVHVTDGLGDLFTPWQLQRTVLAPARTSLPKSLAVVAALRLCRADLEFNPFHPRCSAYAQTSLPADRLPISEQKRRQLRQLIPPDQPRSMVIDGFGLAAEKIAARFGLARYVAPQREGGVIVDGRRAMAGQVICAEELIQILRPDAVIGCPSTSLVAAKLAFPDLPVFCLTPPTANQVRGPGFTTLFRRYASQFGVAFLDAPGVESQLRAAMPPPAADSAFA